MIIALAFLLLAVNSVIFVVTGDWLNGVAALAFAITWGLLVIRRADRKVDRVIQQATTPIDYGKGCRCDWMGAGTPEHDASPLCISLRPDADRDVTS